MLIDYITQEQIKCKECGEEEYLSQLQFVFGTQVHCDTCGAIVRA